LSQDDGKSWAAKPRSVAHRVGDNAIHLRAFGPLRLDLLPRSHLRRRLRTYHPTQRLDVLSLERRPGMGIGPACYRHCPPAKAVQQSKHCPYLLVLKTSVRPSRRDERDLPRVERGTSEHPGLNDPNGMRPGGAREVSRHLRGASVDGDVEPVVALVPRCTTG